ncbi:MAG: hypothetical protein QHH26_13165 [Armatimonadota bacterium]|nr:hypothetical protein [Armatimonadota bacterium]
MAACIALGEVAKKVCELSFVAPIVAIDFATCMAGDCDPPTPCLDSFEKVLRMLRHMVEQRFGLKSATQDRP